MANSRYKHKDYSKLLKSMNKAHIAESTSSNTGVTSIEKDTEDNTSNNNTDTRFEYDLDLVLDTLNYLTELDRIYTSAVNQLDTEQQITQDLLHGIEFASNSKEWYKLSTQLHHARNRRRQCKNVIEVLRPLAEFLAVDTNKRCVNILKNIVGEARKTKSQVTHRTYHPRVLTDLGVIIDGKIKK